MALFNGVSMTAVRGGFMTIGQVCNCTLHSSCTSASSTTTYIILFLDLIYKESYLHLPEFDNSVYILNYHSVILLEIEFNFYTYSIRGYTLHTLVIINYLCVFDDA